MNGVFKMGKPCYNYKCPAYSTKDRVAGNCDFSPDCGDFVGFTAYDRAAVIPCHNSKCEMVPEATRLFGKCPYQRGCGAIVPYEKMMTEFDPSKSNVKTNSGSSSVAVIHTFETNLDYIRSLSAEDFAKRFSSSCCPPHERCKPGDDRSCEDCWIEWLNCKSIF